MQSLFVWGWEGGGNRASRKRRLCLVIQASRTGGARQCRAGGRADCLPRGKHRFYAKRLTPMVFSPSAARRGAGGERKAPCIASIEDNFAVSSPPLAEIDAPTPARGQGLQPYGALDCFEWRSEGGAGGRAESHPACIDRQQLCRKQFPLAGLDAPTPARIGTCRPMGRSHFSFGGERKVCKRKPAARRLREKALDCPFLKDGVRNVARSIVG